MIKKIIGFLGKIFGMIVLLLIPLVVYHNKCISDVVLNYFGTILGAVATIIAVLMTINFSSNLSKKEKENRIHEKSLEIVGTIYAESNLKEQVVYINNNTNYPIFNVIVGTVMNSQHIEMSKGKYDISPAFMKLNETRFLYRINKVNAKSRAKIKTDLAGNGAGHFEDVAFVFRDVYGLTWIRESDGKLLKIDPDKYFKNVDLPDHFASCDFEKI